MMIIRMMAIMMTDYEDEDDDGDSDEDDNDVDDIKKEEDGEDDPLM